MATEALKSLSITNIDATPPVRSSAGAGGMGTLFSVQDFASPTTGVTSGSTYRLVRVPSNAYIKHVTLESHGTITTLTGDTTIYYSDATIDETGSSAGNTGLVNSLSGASALFGNATAMATADTPVEVTGKAGNYPASKRNQPLWQAAGLSTDPGGFFDIVFLLTATNSLTAGATIMADVEYVVGWR